MERGWCGIDDDRPVYENNIQPNTANQNNSGSSSNIHGASRLDDSFAESVLSDIV